MINGLADKHWPRHLFEAGFFVVLISTAWTLDTFTKLTERSFQGGSTDTIILFTHQLTSAFVVMLLIPCSAAYRYYRSREASQVSARPDRLVVQTGSGETIIRQAEIEYLEAARNYVVVGAALSRGYRQRFKNIISN